MKATTIVAMQKRRPARAASPATVLVTGASSGIGEALARCWARDGHRLVLVARRDDRLREVASALAREHGTVVDIVAADLARPGAPEALAADLRRRRRTIDVLVNSAGVLEQGSFVRGSAGQHRQQIDLNVSALTAMLAAFVPGMVRRGRGRVLNVASIAAFSPVPSLAVYAATKAFVLSLTESLAEELRGTGVTATALCPGITATAMYEGAMRDNPGIARLPRMLVGDVERVASEGYRACLAGEVVAIPGAANRAIAAAGGAIPKALLRRMAGTLGRRMMK